MPLEIQPPGARTARRLVTPEGVPLGLGLASLSERAAAFGIDVIIILAALVLGGLAAFLAFSISREAAGALASAIVFAVTNGYFVWFELRWAGRTPGKRMAGIRVVSRSGGPLRADAVIARNLVRNVEFIIPLLVLALREAVLPDATVATWVAMSLWLLALMLLPVFNGDHLRVGDLVAGTWVVRAPKAALARDLARQPTGRSRQGAATSAPTYGFTPEQLEVYGIYELQALEDVLRNRTPDAAEVRKAVARKVVAKLGYDAPRGFETDRFLSDFYAALRAHLERRLLLGKRKDRKDP